MLKNIIYKTLNMNIKILNLNYKNINRTNDKSRWIKCKDPYPSPPINFIYIYKGHSKVVIS